VALFGAVLTAAYMVRATYLTFFGEPRGAAAGEHHVDEEHAEEHELETLTVGARDLGAAANRSGEGGAGEEPHGGSGGGAADAAPDHHDDHHGDGPHESGPLILVPIVILAFLALVAGFANATPLGESFEHVKTYVEPRPVEVPVDELQATGPGDAVVQVVPSASDGEGGEGGGEEEAHGPCGYETPEGGTACFFPSVDHAEPTFPKIMLSLGVVAAGYAVSIAFCVAYYGRRDRRLVGLTDRSRILRGGYVFLTNKYYLDWLYERVIVRAIAHPIANAAYWVNQKVIDGVVNGVGRGGKRTGDWVYENIDQRVVDGAVNGSGFVASETGHGLQPMQSGKVSQYGALLFAAAAVGAIVLVIVNVN
jgi:NADH-quinone oxidoreductase subunit L